MLIVAVWVFVLAVSYRYLIESTADVSTHQHRHRNAERISFTQLFPKKINYNADELNSDKCFCLQPQSAS